MIQLPTLSIAQEPEKEKVLNDETKGAAPGYRKRNEAAVPRFFPSVLFFIFL